MRTRPRTDVDPPRFLDQLPSAGEGISSRRTRGDKLFLFFSFLTVTPSPNSITLNPNRGGGKCPITRRKSSRSPVKAAAPAVTSNKTAAATAIVSDVTTRPRRGAGYDAINDVIIAFPSRAERGGGGILLRRQVLVLRAAVDETDRDRDADSGSQTGRD